MADEYAINLMRMIAAELHFQNTMTVSRDLFGKSYFSLGMSEKVAVDQAVFGHVAAQYQAITPEYLTGQAPRAPMGFGIQAATNTTPPNQEESSS